MPPSCPAGVETEDFNNDWSITLAHIKMSTIVAGSNVFSGRKSVV